MTAAIIQDFFQAIRAGQLDNVNASLAADPELLKAKDENGLGPYIAAKYSRHEDIAALLLEKGVDLDIFAACMAGDGERITNLLDRDRQLANRYSHDGWTPLHLAAFFGHKQIADILLEQGADVHARSRNAMENLPIHAAAASRKASIVAALLEHGASVNARQHGGWTPLHAASQNGDSNLVRLLVANGADVGARAANNQSAIDLALTGGHQDVVDILDGSART